MKKIVILASGRGSNAEAIYNFSKTNAFEIAAIISDNAKALVLEKAKNWNVPAIAVPRQVKETRGDHEARLMGQLKKLDFDLIVLAGYARLLSQQFLSEFPPRTIVNIHPSLLPLYPGLNSYQRAFADGVKESGITIHFVDEGMDTGEIILQEKFSREPSDDLESFEKRGLALEHKHYPEAIATILNQNFLYRVEIYPKKANLLAKPENLTAKLFWIKSEGPLPRLQNYVNDVLIDSVVE
jgi:phosphoribosylglycinamide formyltransferase-1